MTAKQGVQVMHPGECSDHCSYKMGITGEFVLCEFCGRIKMAKENGAWKVLY